MFHTPPYAFRQYLTLSPQNTAESLLDPRTADHYAAASLDGFFLADIGNCFRKCRLVPRILPDVSSMFPQTTIFGLPSALPTYISPASANVGLCLPIYCLLVVQDRFLKVAFEENRFDIDLIAFKVEVDK